MSRYRQPGPVFVALALLFGTAFAVLSPPLTAPDEGRHFARILLTAEGQLRIPAPETGPSIPRSAVQLYREVGALWPQREPGTRTTPAVLLRFLGRPLEPERRAPVQNLPNYGPVAYAPQAVGVALGRVFGLSAAALVHLGRLANLLAWVALMAGAIRIAPRRRWVLCLLGLLPMHLYLAATLSADAVTNGLALLFVAGVLKLGFDATRPPRLADAAWLCLVATLLALTKPGYAAVVATAIVLPASRIGSPRSRWALLVALACCALLPWLLWSAHTSDFAFPSTNTGIDPAAQLRWILGHPVSFLGVVATTLASNAGAYAKTFVGVLGRLDIVLPSLLYPIVLGAILAAALADGEDPPAFSPGRRVLLAVVAVGIGGLFVGSAYLMWNAVGAPQIAGIQGRYFIPLAFPLLVAVPARAHRFGPHTHPGPWIAFVAVTLVIALGANLLHYYAW